VPSWELGPIRPPSESTSLLIRITRNCPWNKCAFCAVYKGRDFSRRSEEELLAEISHLESTSASVRQRLGLGPNDPPLDTTHALELIRQSRDDDEKRLTLWMLRGEGKVFLQDGDSLVLPARKLIRILEELRRAFPEIREVTTYARSRTLCAKSPADLQALKEAGLTRIHVGLESGSDAVLALIEKGCRAEHHLEGCARALAAGLQIACYVMPGLGGAKLTLDHAEKTAAVLRIIEPGRVRLRTLWIDPGSPLEAMEKSGQFVLLEEEEIVAEIRSLLASLQGASLAVVSDHDRNLLCDLEGRLDNDAAELLAHCDLFLELPRDHRDAFVLARRFGHALYLETFLKNPAAVSHFTHWAKQISQAGGGSLLKGMRATLGRRSI
jgi:radical SAM superfamily enzyme YgiQ (UPF0313 family)